MLETCRDWLVDLTWRVLAEALRLRCNTWQQPAFNREHTPYSPVPYGTHAVESDGRAFRDSTVISVWECLTPKGSLSVPQNRLRRLTLNSFPIPPLPEGRGLLGGLRVNCVTLKDVFLNNDLTGCDVLKIDCEGAEKEIFCDEFKTCLGQASLILLEWHNYDGAFYAEYLRNIGFLVSITGCGCPAPPYDPTFARGMLYARQYQSGGISVAH